MIAPGAAGLGLGDPEFVRRFPVECPSRIWELYLAHVFDSWGWQLVPSRKPGEGPDFGIDLTNRDGTHNTMWIEATAPMPGTGPNRTGFHPIGRSSQAMAFGAELQRTQSLRILQALQAK
ncbi:MAG TPA: hypothetical protein VK524_21890 [Polyangiaceae bacterium]|nr:hypothetical protein [Polyangiaceae bacterium]